MTNEILTIEQLESVSGGSAGENKVDIAFFIQLDYNITDSKSFKKAFKDNGIEFENFSEQNNEYSINGQKYPHWAALGYILKRKNYPGFNGSWTDSKYVHSFLKDHFHISDCG